MKYIMTTVWAVLLGSLLNYVVSSVQNVGFDPMNGLILAAGLVVMIIVIQAILPNEPAHAGHHE